MTKKQNVSVFSKVFTVVFVVVLLALLVFSYVILGVTPDFVKPISFNVDTNCYEYTLDEFAEFLNEKEYMSETQYTSFSVDGVTEARRYGDTVLLRWDTENMDKESEAYSDWKRYSNIGNMTLNDGSFIIVYGCFGASYKEKAEGETTETYKIFEGFPMDYSGNHGNLTVWDCTFEQFIDYMVQLGHFNREDALLMTTIGTENWIYDSVDVMWWDVDNLAEGTDAANYWKEFQENGGYIMFGGSVYAPVFNGPFAIKANAGFSGNTDKLYEDFMNFPKNYTPSEG